MMVAGATAVGGDPPEVVIARCVLRVRRFGGWSWGARPDALLAAARRALPG
ncbi:MAG: hypothetical protein H6709_11305 [Kofleriaceae bacterium]|nr:hypothetical protein [Kofleriaceae bacterium]